MLTHLYLATTFLDNYLAASSEELLLSTHSSDWGLTALDVMRSMLGWGESEENNVGSDLDIIRRDPDRQLRQGSWCAYAVSYALQESFARRMGYVIWNNTPIDVRKECPINLRDETRSGSRNRRGARRLWKKTAAVGTIVKSPLPGDLVLWDRGRERWMAHIGIVNTVDFDLSDDNWTYLAGNEGKFPSVIRKHKGHRRRLIGFVRPPAI